MARALVAGAVLMVVGGSAAKAAYWNVFNFEGESTQSAEFATYPTLPDMLSDTNRTGVFVPNAFGVGRNIVGSGASILAAPPPPTVVSEPAAIALLAGGVVGLALMRRPARIAA